VEEIRRDPISAKITTPDSGCECLVSNVHRIYVNGVLVAEADTDPIQFGVGSGNAENCDIHD
jgi:hypothetical protein